MALCDHSLTRLSEPPVTKRRRGACGWPAGAAALVSWPGARAGLQETALTPMPWAGKMVCWKELFSKLSTLTEPSEEAAARWQPGSGGDQAIRLTEAVCRVNS